VTWISMTSPFSGVRYMYPLSHTYIWCEDLRECIMHPCFLGKSMEIQISKTKFGSPLWSMWLLLIPLNYLLYKKLLMHHYCYFYVCYLAWLLLPDIFSYNFACRYWLDTKTMQNLLLLCAQLSPMFFQEVNYQRIRLLNSCLCLDVVIRYLKGKTYTCRKGQNGGIVEYWGPYNICCHRWINYQAKL